MTLNLAVQMDGMIDGLGKYVRCSCLCVCLMNHDWRIIEVCVAQLRI